MKPKMLLFDVYETLLSMESIKRSLNQILDSKRGYTIWFELLIQNCLLENTTSKFHGFATIADACLQMTHHLLGQPHRPGEFVPIMESMKHLPLQEDIQEGLSSIYDQDFRIAALTNSPEKIVIERMERTGLVSYFEAILSAEQIKAYKPGKNVYLWAAEKFQLTPGEIMLVSSHGWDIAGATNAGMTTAYLRSSRQLFNPLAELPTFNCDSLLHLAAELKKKYTDNFDKT